MRHFLRLAAVVFGLGLAACSYQFAGLNTVAEPGGSSRDLSRLLASPQSQQAVVTEISTSHDSIRLDALLAELLATAGNTGGRDAATWQGLLPGMDFRQRLDMLNVLADEQRRLRTLERETR